MASRAVTVHRQSGPRCEVTGAIVGAARSLGKGVCLNTAAHGPHTAEFGSLLCLFLTEPQFPHLYNRLPRTPSPTWRVI